MDGHQPKSDKPFDPETAVPPPSGTGVQPPREAKPSDTERMLNRVSMTPDGAHAIVEMIVQVKAQSWGPDCTVAQAAAQAVESATGRLRNILNPPPGLKPDTGHGVKLLGARCVRVVCEAKRDG